MADIVINNWSLQKSANDQCLRDTSTTKLQFEVGIVTWSASVKRVRASYRQLECPWSKRGGW
jgi:hypothetical protein